VTKRLFDSNELRSTATSRSTIQVLESITKNGVAEKERTFDLEYQNAVATLLALGFVTRVSGQEGVTYEVTNEGSRFLKEYMQAEKTALANVAIIVPAMNEERAIGPVLDGIHDALTASRLPVRSRIVVVDGGSIDGTVPVARSGGATVISQRRTGYGDALLLGFHYATKSFEPDILVMIDGDGTYDAQDIPKILLPILNGHADMVLGNRFPCMESGAMTTTNRLGNRAISWFCRRLLGLHIHDTQCGLRALTANLVNTINGHAEGMPFATEMLADADQAGARIEEIPVMYHVRRVGNTKLNPLRDGVKILGVILRLVRDYRPLFFFGGIGLVFIILGLLVGIGVLQEWLSTGTVSRIPSAILAGALLGAGVQVLSLGLLADMIKQARHHKFVSLE
jgi:glycosyltransferase involved in cell wall biosynthesis